MSMNRQIVQLFGLTLVLFGVLIAFTSRWTVFEAASLEDNTLNRRGLIEQQQVPRGLILARDGDTVLAQSDPSGRGKQLTYVRSYPEGETSATRSATRTSTSARAGSSGRATMR